MTPTAVKPQLLVILVVGLVTGAWAQSNAGQNFITVDYPGSTLTSLRVLNSHGEFAGRYIDTAGVIHGFVSQNNVFTAINYPNALATAVWGLNDNGVVVGRYFDGVTDHAFVLNNGVFSSFDPPGSIDTYALGINNLDQIVGFYEDANFFVHGFELSNGVYTTLDFPNSTSNELLKVNNEGTIVGIYLDSAGNQHGMTITNGVFTNFDYPDAVYTDLYGLNDGGQLAGGYAFSLESSESGFTYTNGVFTTVDFAAAVGGLLVEDINDAGQIVGEYVDSAGVNHGFASAVGPFAYVANIDSNTVTMIDVPTQLPVNTIQVGAGPWGVAIAPNGAQIYVSNNHGNSVSVIDATSNSVSATIPVQASPFGVAFTPDGTQAYVVNGSSNSVSVIDATSQTVAATVPVGTSPVGVAMAATSNGTFAYVTNSAAGTVSVIAVGGTPTVVQTINVGSEPRWVAVAPNSSLAYVENAGGNNVSVISVATNTVTATIPVGSSPFGATFSPDNTFGYVVNSGSNTISVIDTASNTVVDTISGFESPVHIALTPDGTFGFVTNLGTNNVSVLTAATNQITDTVPVGVAPIGVAIASAPPTTLVISQPLSPTQPNVFNFGTNSQTITYPPGTNFSNVVMNVAAQQITQADFQKRVAGTAFANATCIVYSGNGGNCVDNVVTCTSSGGGSIPCPSEAQPSISVETDFTTSQAIVGPGYLTTPVGKNNWKNIFDSFTDPKVKGKTKGFSEFVAVDLGATNSQGLAKFKLLEPATKPTLRSGLRLTISFKLTSAANKTAVTDAKANMSVTLIADANGNPVNQVVFSAHNLFTQSGTPGLYTYGFCTKRRGNFLAVGTYTATIYGNAFAAHEVKFKLIAP